LKEIELAKEMSAVTLKLDLSEAELKLARNKLALLHISLVTFSILFMLVVFGYKYY